MLTDTEPELGRFRTPLAAAMLTGALAGVYGILIKRSIYSSNWFFSLYASCDFILPALVDVPLSIVSLSGPVISRRNLSLFKFVLLWSVAIVVARICSEWILAQTFRLLMYKLTTIYWIVSTAIYCIPHGLLFGFALARLYGLNRCPKLSLILAIVGFVLSSAVFNLSIRMYDPSHTDINYYVFMIVPAVLLRIVICVFPTIPIERELKRQARSTPLVNPVLPTII